MLGANITVLELLEPLGQAKGSLLVRVLAAYCSTAQKHQKYLSWRRKGGLGAEVEGES